MSVHNKVVWSEGLFLQPQHFQQQDRYFERYVEARAEALVPHAWGFAEVEIDADLLKLGKIGVRRAVGVFPDGTPFRLPDDDPLPRPLDVAAMARNETDLPCRARAPCRPAGSGPRRPAPAMARAPRRARVGSTGRLLRVWRTGHAAGRVAADADSACRRATDAYACIPLALVSRASR